LQEFNNFENKCIGFKIADLLLKYGANVDWIVDKKKGYSFLYELIDANNNK
jgi:hypothetical protein